MFIYDLGILQIKSCTDCPELIQCPIVWLGTRPWPGAVNLYVTLIGSDIMWVWDISLSYFLVAHAHHKKN